MTSPHARTTYRKARLICGVLSTLLVIGCSNGLFAQRPSKPAQPVNQACAQSCELLKTQCQQRQEYRERECGTQYAAARKDYDQCRGSNAGHCKAPDTCLGADMSICDRELADCVRACGNRAEPQIAPSTVALPTNVDK